MQATRQSGPAPQTDTASTGAAVAPDVAASPGASRDQRSAAVRFFGVVARRQTWLNFVYLWLAFPLGLFYFIFLVTGLSLGLGLVIVWVGIPILFVVIIGSWLFAAFERWQARVLLGVVSVPAPRAWEQMEGPWAKLKAHLANPSTWTDLLYLFLKLPLGIIEFTFAVVVAALVAQVLGAPLSYEFTGVVGWWHVHDLWLALVAVPFGLIGTFAGLHVLNGVARVNGMIAEMFFGGSPTQSLTPGDGQ